MSEKVKWAGIEFDVIDLTKVKDVDYHSRSELIPNPDDNPLITKLSLKIHFAKQVKRDIKYQEDMLKIVLPESRPQSRKYIAKLKRKLKKLINESYDICEELGWVTRDKGQRKTTQTD